jgi:hypothetical protein
VDATFASNSNNSAPAEAYYMGLSIHCAKGNAVCADNNGDAAPEINTTFLGLVGPGVQHQGVNNAVWSDHTDIVPTMWDLLGRQFQQRQRLQPAGGHPRRARLGA